MIHRDHHMLARLACTHREITGAVLRMVRSIEEDPPPAEQLRALGGYLRAVGEQLDSRAETDAETLGYPDD
ncbi:hypothetical protein H0B56_07055 [Haloechinothrix sp. YIM 98757]|uniref:Uncharacterized protein n=1 Tax=Haloechinothrix aidingensis TaxID=2752311 RepID=A0A838A8X5_9PSEU|nr:hypothetical protein [Haloechinothrix aidingensis]MBA0125297.1 hypothetical protein [Haloechinothrix aidingensis]